MYQWPSSEERKAWLAKVRESITSLFDESELQTLCADLVIDYDSLRGSCKADKARELVLYGARHGQLHELIQKCRETRPNVDWPDSPPWITGMSPGYLSEALKRWRFPRWFFIVFGVALVGLVVAMGYLFTSSATVALQTSHQRYAAVTDVYETWRLKAKAEQKDEMSRFTLLCLKNDNAALQFGDRFVSARDNTNNQNWELRAEVTEQQAWEEFKLFDPDTRDPLSCRKVLLRLYLGRVNLAIKTHHGYWVTAMGADKDWVLRAETTELKAYERFVVTRAVRHSCR